MLTIVGAIAAISLTNLSQRLHNPKLGEERTGSLRYASLQDDFILMAADIDRAFQVPRPPISESSVMRDLPKLLTEVDDASDLEKIFRTALEASIAKGSHNVEGQTLAALRAKRCSIMRAGFEAVLLFQLLPEESKSERRDMLFDARDEVAIFRRIGRE